MTEEEIAEMAERFLEIQMEQWEVEWKLRDACLLLVENFDEGVVRRVAQGWGTSHRNVFKWAQVARYWPIEKRMPHLSVRTHTTYMNADLKEKNDL